MVRFFIDKSTPKEIKFVTLGTFSFYEVHAIFMYVIMDYLEQHFNNAIMDDKLRNIKGNTCNSNRYTHSFGVLSHSLNAVLFIVSKIA